MSGHRLICVLAMVALSSATIQSQVQDKGPPALDAHGDPLPPAALARVGSVRFRVPETSLAVQFADGGKTLLARTQRSHDGAEGAIYAFDAISGKPLNRLDAALHRVMTPRWVDGTWCVSTDGKWLAAVEEMRRPERKWTVTVKEATTGQKVFTHVDPGRYFTDMQFSPDGKSLFTAAKLPWDRDDKVAHLKPVIQLWDIAGNKEIRTFAMPVTKESTWEPRQLMVSPDGRFLAATGLIATKTAAGDFDEIVMTCVWEVSTGKLLPALDSGGTKVPVLAFSPDGRMVAGVVEGIVQFWDPLTGKRTGQMGKTFATCYALEFSIDGKHLMVAGDPGNGIDLDVQLWNLASGKEIDLPLPKRYRKAGWLFAPDGQTLVLYTEASIVVCAVDKAKLQWNFAHSFYGAFHATRNGQSRHGMDLPVALAPDGKTLVAAGRAGPLRRWDLITGKEIPSLGPNTALASLLAYSADGKKLLAGAGEELRMHDLDGNQPTLALMLLQKRKHRGLGNHADLLTAIVFSHDNSRAAAAWYDGTVAVWDTANGKCLWQTQGREMMPEALAFTEDNGALIIAAANYWVIWRDAANGNIRRELHMHDVTESVSGRTRYVCLTPGAATVLAKNPKSGVLEEWELASGLKRRDSKIIGPPTAVSPDRRWLLVGSTIFDLLTGAEQRTFYCPGDIAVSPDSRTLACIVSADLIHFCDLATGTVFSHLSGHPGGVNTIAFAPDGKSLAACCGDGTILIWKVPARPTAGKPAPLTEKEQNASWQTLIGDDATKAGKALASLAAAEGTAALVKQKLAIEQVGGDIGLTRIVELLERLGSEEARGLLKQLANGPPDAWPTRQAALAWQRLSAKPQALAADPLPLKDGAGQLLPAGAKARLGSLAFQAGGRCNTLRYLPDGNTLVAWHDSSAKYGNAGLMIWDAQTGNALKEHKEKPDSYRLGHRSMTNDGQCLAALTQVAGVGNSFETIYRGIRFLNLTSGETRHVTLDKPAALTWLQFSADGKTLVATDRGSKAVVLFDTANATEQRRFALGAKDEFDPRWAMLSPDGRFVVAGGFDSAYDRALCWWDAKKGGEPRRFLPFGHGASALSGFAPVAMSPDSKYLALRVGEPEFKNGRLALLELATGKLVCDLGPCNWAPYNLVFSPDGKQLTALYDGVRRWSVPDGKVLPSLDAEYAQVIQYSPDGRLLGVAMGNGSSLSRKETLGVFDAATGQQLQRYPMTVGMRGIDGQTVAEQGFGATFAFSPDGKKVAAAHGLTIRQWDLASGKEIGHGAQVDSVHSVASSHDGRIVAACDDSAVRVWDAQTGKLLCRVEAWLSAKITEANLTAVAVSPSGKEVVVGGSDGTILVVDAQSGQRRRQLRLHEAAVVALTFLADGTLLSADQGGGAAAWNVTDGKLLRRLADSIKGKEKRYRFDAGPIFSSSGNLQALPGDSSVKIIDLASGKSRLVVKPGPAIGFSWGRCATTPALSPDGKVLAVPMLYVPPSDVIHEMLSFHLFDAQTGALLRSLEGIHRIWTCCFSPDGTLLAACGDGRIRIWDTATGTVRAEWTGHGGRVTTIDFSPHGRTLFSAGDDGTVLAWDIATIVKKATSAGPTKTPLPTLWATMAAANPATAWQAMEALLTRPAEAAAFIKGHLPPVAAVPPAQLAELIAALDDNRPKVREAASADLAKMLDLAEPALRSFLKGAPTLEQKQRIDLLLAKLHDAPKDPGVVRALRAIEVWEMLETNEAAAELARLANGAPSSVVTRAARAALARLRRTVDAG